MSSVTVESFHSDPYAAEAASECGPVFITEQGEPRRVLIHIDEYRRLTHPGAAPIKALVDKGMNLTTALAMPEDQYFDWEPPRLEGLLFEPADFS